MATDELREIGDMMCDLLAIETVLLTADMTAADVDGWDSFRQVELIVAMQERWGIVFTSGELDAIETFGALGDLLRCKRGA